MHSESKDARKITNRFANSYNELAGAKKTTYIAASDLNVFGDTFSSGSSPDITISDFPCSEKFDIIFGDMPLGMQNCHLESDANIRNTKFPKNWVLIYDALDRLAEEGVGFFTVESHGFSTSHGKKFRRILEDSGYFINAFLDTPKGILAPISEISPVIVMIGKEHTEEIFVAELDIFGVELVASNLVNLVDSESIEYGMFLKLQEFKGFAQLRAISQIENLETQYDQYGSRQLHDISSQINRVKSGETFTDQPNSIYVPSLGNSPVIARFGNLTMRHQNYFQVVLTDTVANEYVASFLNSALGKLIRASLTTGGVIPHINKREIEKLIVALPDISQQQGIVQTHQKLHRLKNAINLFDSEISLNPTKSSIMQKQLDSMLEAIDKLTDADKIRAIIRNGESKKAEFKETLSLDVRKNTKEKYIEISALKSLSSGPFTSLGYL